MNVIDTNKFYIKSLRNDIDMYEEQIKGYFVKIYRLKSLQAELRAKIHSLELEQTRIDFREEL